MCSIIRRPRRAKFIASIAEKEVAACGANPPYAIFCDSLESLRGRLDRTFSRRIQNTSRL